MGVSVRVANETAVFSTYYYLTILTSEKSLRLSTVTIEPTRHDSRVSFQEPQGHTQHKEKEEKDLGV
jgi:hypothetical protein